MSILLIKDVNPEINSIQTNIKIILYLTTFKSKGNKYLQKKTWKPFEFQGSHAHVNKFTLFICRKELQQQEQQNYSKLNYLDIHNYSPIYYNFVASIGYCYFIVLYPISTLPI